VGDIIHRRVDLLLAQILLLYATRDVGITARDGFIALADSIV
jgi:hypothetical protein